MADGPPRARSNATDPNRSGELAEGSISSVAQTLRYSLVARPRKGVGNSFRGYV